jgi:hypothetical protein
MPSAFSPNKNLELQATGENQGSWGTNNNANFSLLDSILGGGLAIAITGSNVTLTAAQAANLYYRLTGTQTANVDLTFPAGGFFVIDNDTTSTVAYTVTAKAAGGGRSFIVARGQKTMVFSDGTNIDPVQSLPAQWCGATAGTSTAYTVTAPGNISRLTTGLLLHVQWDETSGAAPTLNVSGLGARAIYKPGAAGPVAVDTGELPVGGTSLLLYDATLNAGAGAWVVLTGIAQIPTSRTITAGTGLTGGGDLTANRSIALANTAVTPGSYGGGTQVGTFTVDAQGRLTAAANVSINAVSALGYTPANKAGDTFTGAVTIQVSTTSPGGFTSTDAGATKAPVDLFRDSGSPAVNDQLVSVAFTGRSNTASKRTYAEIVPVILDPTNTSEDCALALRTIAAGTEADRFLVAQGLYSSGVAGGDKGVGTINLGNGYWRSNALLPRQVRGVSSALTIGVNTTRSAAHGLGSAPTIFGAYMVCTSPDIGYAVGTVMELGTHSSGGTDYGLVLTSNATNIVANFPTNGMLLPNGGGGGNAAPNSGRWDLFLWWETS